MDSLTQIVLGAATGEVVLGRKIGNKALLWGGIIATIPDLDVLLKYAVQPIDALVSHRGFSHSIVFFFLLSPLLGYFLNFLYKKLNVSWREWTIFSFWCLLTHPLLDIFTTWGTQLFWPLEWRISINSIFVIDPLYTVPFIVFLIMVMRRKKESDERRKWNRIGIIVSCSYLAWSVLAKEIAHSAMHNKLEEKGITSIRFESKPMPLTTFYWEGMAETDSGFYIGHYSLFGGSDKIDFRYIEKHHEFASELGFDQTKEFQKLVKFSRGFYSLTKSENHLDFMDLRFGITDGITNEIPPNVIFIFHLKKENGTVVFLRDRNHLEGGFKNFRNYFSKIFGR